MAALPRRARLRRRGGPLLVVLSGDNAAPSERDRLLRPPGPGDDRRGADRRTRLARELVVVARPHDGVRHQPAARRLAATSGSARSTWPPLAMKTVKGLPRHDLVGFMLAERAKPADVARVLDTYYTAAATMTYQGLGDAEKFMGDGMMVTFNTRGDQPDLRLQPLQAALAIQRELTPSRRPTPGWPSAARRREQRPRFCARDGRRIAPSAMWSGRHVNTSASRSRARHPRAAC